MVGDDIEGSRHRWTEVDVKERVVFDTPYTVQW